MKKGKLILFSGPSGVGKKTVLSQIINKPELNLEFSISMTTREPRPFEKDGVDYFFVSKEYFLEQIKNNKMLEYAKFFDNYYGTPKEYVVNKLNSGKNVVLEIEVIGAEIVMEKMPDCLSIFILPPSIEELRKRLIKRNTEPLEKIEKRLLKAKTEMDLKHLYKFNVLNENATQAAIEIEKIIKENC